MLGEVQAIDLLAWKAGVVDGRRAQAMVLQMQHVHREMYARLYGPKGWLVRGAPPALVPVNPQRLLELWDYEGQLSEQVRTRHVNPS